MSYCKSINGVCNIRPVKYSIRLICRDCDDWRCFGDYRRKKWRDKHRDFILDWNNNIKHLRFFEVRSKLVKIEKSDLMC